MPRRYLREGKFLREPCRRSTNNRFQDDLYELMDIVDDALDARPELKTVPKDFSYREINQ